MPKHEPCQCGGKPLLIDISHKSQYKMPHKASQKSQRDLFYVTCTAAGCKCHTRKFPTALEAWNAWNFRSNYKKFSNEFYIKYAVNRWERYELRDNNNLINEIHEAVRLYNKKQRDAIEYISQESQKIKNNRDIRKFHRLTGYYPVTIKRRMIAGQFKDLKILLRFCEAIKQIKLEGEA